MPPFVAIPMLRAVLSPRAVVARQEPDAACAPPTFDEVYDAWAEFVYFSLRRLGVAPDHLADAVQDVFVVVHRKLPSRDGDLPWKTWLFRIAMNVAREHRRAHRRQGDPAALPDDLRTATPDPHACAEQSEAVRALDRVLDALDEDHRAVFILMELEQCTAPEVAAALAIPVNTVYSRLRAARTRFDAAVAKLQRGGAR